MKPSYVSNLTTEQSVTTFLLVCEKEVRSTKEGKPYLRLELGDRSGTIEARMWDQIDAISKEVDREDIVKVQGRVEIYRGKPQLSVQQMRKAKPDEVDLADFLPSTKEDVEKLFKQLLAEAASIKNPWLNKLTTAILHDVGKLDELCYDRAIGYTSDGQLLGHIVMEIETVANAINKIEGFPPALKTVVQHILISHHGQYEFGSPKLPMIREALVFHYMDDLDSKLAAARAALAGESGDELWSVYSGALPRKFLRLDKFLKAADSAAAAK